MEYDTKHKQLLDIAIQILRRNIPDLIAVIAFGSFGTPYEREDSDLDLAILAEETHPLDAVKIWNLAQEIAIKIGRDVEVINLRKASTVFCFQVLSSGTPVYCSNDLKLAHYDNLIMSMYLRFQEERKDILSDFEKGIFYGG
jgi:uncharacterized protein